MRPSKEPTFDIKLAKLVELVRYSLEMKKIGYPLEYIPILKEEIPQMLLRLIAQDLTSISFRELIASTIIGGEESTRHLYPQTVTIQLENILVTLKAETGNVVIGKEITESLPLVAAFDGMRIWDSNELLLEQFNLNMAVDEKYKESFVVMWQQGLVDAGSRIDH